MNKKAEDYFRCTEENYGCAQSILKAFQEKFNISNEMIAEYRKYGGGQADDNMCGALFAATQLLKDNTEKQELIKKEFATTIGSTKCKEIRQAKLHSCKDCVRVAGELLQNSL